MMKKLFTALITGALAIGMAALCHFGMMSVSAEAYTYEPITGLANGSHYSGAVFYYLTDDTLMPYDGSVPSMTGLGYTVSMESNPKNGASGMPVVSDASFPGPATFQGEPNEPIFTWSSIDDSNITFTKPGEYIWKLTPKAVTYPAGIESVNSDYEKPLYIHAFITDSNGTLNNYSVFISHSGAPAPVDYHGEAVLTLPKTQEILFRYQTSEISLSKQVTGNAGDKSKQFMFTVNLTGCNPGTVIDGVTVAADGTWTKNYGLTHGDSFTIDGIPTGAGYTITEINADDYTTSFECLVPQNGWGPEQDLSSAEYLPNTPTGDLGGYDHFWGNGEGQNLLPGIITDGQTRNGVLFDTSPTRIAFVDGTATEETISCLEDITDYNGAMPPCVLQPGTYTIAAHDITLYVQSVNREFEKNLPDTEVSSGTFRTFTVQEDSAIYVRAIASPADGELHHAIHATIVEGEKPLAEWEPFSNGKAN